MHPKTLLTQYLENIRPIFTELTHATRYGIEMKIQILGSKD